MKNLTISITVIVVFVPLLLISCSKNKHEANQAPLKADMVFSYKQKMTFRGKELSKKVSFKFEKLADKMFQCNRTVTDKYGLRSRHPIHVNAYFKRKKKFDLLVSTYPIWRNPIQLESGKIGTKKVVAGFYNGKNVYTLIRTKNEKVHYNKSSGIFEGAALKLKNRSQIIVRIR